MTWRTQVENDRSIKDLDLQIKNKSWNEWRRIHVDDHCNRYIGYVARLNLLAIRL